MGNGLERHLPADQVDELRRLTAFSGDEIRTWHAQFSRRCPDGRMTPDDFHVMYAQLFPDGDATAFAQRVFHAYDRDRNGVIDFREFVISVSISSRGSIDDKLRWIFGIYDVDGDGHVTEDEVRDMCEAMFKLRGSAGIENASPRQVADEIFRGLDQNNDKRLCRTEFVVGAKSSPLILSVLDNFAQPDAD